MKSIFKSIGWVILNLVLQFIVQLVFTICAIKNGITDENLLNEWLMDRLLITTIISNLLFVLVSILICRIKKVKVKEEWKIVKLGIKSYFIPCIIAFTYSMSFSLITYDAVGNALSPMHIGAEHYGVWGIPMLILTILISAPIAEEIMCRGIMMNTLKKSFSTKTAIIVSSLIFGIMHILTGSSILALGAIIMGLILAIIYEKTDSLYVAIVAHAVANSPDFILYTSPQINNGIRISLAFILLGISAICLLKWCKSKKLNK